MPSIVKYQPPEYRYDYSGFMVLNEEETKRIKHEIRKLRSIQAEINFQVNGIDDFYFSNGKAATSKFCVHPINEESYAQLVKAFGRSYGYGGKLVRILLTGTYIRGDADD